MAEKHSWLKDKYRAIFGYTGLIYAIAGVTMLCPLIALLAYPEEIDLAISFIFPGLFLVAIGLLLWSKLKDSSAILNIKDGAIVVVLSWVIAIAFLMLLGTLNFLTSYLFLTGKFSNLFRNSEIRLQALVIPLSIFVLWAGIISKLDLTLSKALRVAIFEVITALSTTGFSTVSYIDWRSIGWLVMIVLMLIGGGTGATAGGIKQYRIYALYRGIVWEIRRQLLPKDAVTEPDIWQGESRIFLSDRQLRQISMYVWLYLGVYLAGSGIICAYGYSLPESLFEYASALSTVGLSVEVTAPDAPTGLLWTEIIGMFLGRLEFLPAIVGVIQIYRDIRKILGSK